MFNRILVPIDGSATSSAGLAEAIRLAGLTGGRLRLVHVLDELAFTGGMEVYGAEVLKRLQEGGQKVLTEGERAAKAAGVPVETKLFESFGDRLADLVAKDAAEWKPTSSSSARTVAEGCVALFSAAMPSRSPVMRRCRCCCCARKASPEAA